MPLFVEPIRTGASGTGSSVVEGRSPVAVSLWCSGERVSGYSADDRGPVTRRRAHLQHAAQGSHAIGHVLQAGAHARFTPVEAWPFVSYGEREPAILGAEFHTARRQRRVFGAILER